MKTIKIILTDEEYQKIRRAAIAHGEGVPAFITSILFPPNTSSLVQQALIHAKSAASNFDQKEKPFLLKELFDSETWKSMSGTDRQSLGRAFKACVDDGTIANVKLHHKDSANKTFYTSTSTSI